MNKYQAKAIMSKHLPVCPPAPEWIGRKVSTSWRGEGTVVEAFHNVNNGITIKVKYPNGSGYTFTNLVTVI
jgi:hypothetical protein